MEKGKSPMWKLTKLVLQNLIVEWSSPGAEERCGQGKTGEG